MSDITFQRESLSPQLLDEMIPMTLNHFEEVCEFADIKPQVRIADYERAEESGQLRIFTARNGSLAGYAVFIVNRHPHYAESLQANQTLLYLAPEYRKGPLGRFFVESCDDALRKEGVEVVYHSSSVKKDIGSMLSRIGYKPVETVWALRLNP